ncbi:unnamed protein product [Linum trigynum]|uniref:Uncharacterized protein n=3 Tax=Linum trigynum TaxID=586398 RepID=A0AAV2FUI7_9ROSI
MEGGSNSEQPKKKKRVSKDDVIVKLKDDGDFDNLRLKIIRKLKADEEFRSGIISIVRKSAVLNGDGGSNMKPRQLSDAIFDEVGNTMMTMVSDSLWGIIKSDDMSNEITETVQSVYDKLSEPEKKIEATFGSHDEGSVRNEASIMNAKPCAVGDDFPGDESNEPSGFLLPINHQNNGKILEDSSPSMSSERPVEVGNGRPNHSENSLGVHDVDMSILTGFSVERELNQPCDDSDEDPDVPPGFG